MLFITNVTALRFLIVATAWFYLVQATEFRFGPRGEYVCRCAEAAPCDTQTGRCPGDRCAEGYYNPSCQIESIAFRKRATQSATVLRGVPSRAIDGNDNNAYGGNSCTHTPYTSNYCLKAKEGKVWWQVDLGQVHDVASVWIRNRGDCCAARMNGLKVLVSKVDGKWSNASMCYYANKFVPSGEWLRRPCQRPLRGRYIRIVKFTCESSDTNKAILTICEVIVPNFTDHQWMKTGDRLHVVELTHNSAHIQWKTPDWSLLSVIDYRTTLRKVTYLNCTLVGESAVVHQSVKSGLTFKVDSLESNTGYMLEVQPLFSGPIGGVEVLQFSTSAQHAVVNLKLLDVKTHEAMVQLDVTQSCRDSRPAEFWIFVKDTNGRSFTLSTTNSLTRLTKLSPDAAYTVYAAYGGSRGLSRWTSVSLRTQKEKELVSVAQQTPVAVPALSTLCVLLALACLCASVVAWRRRPPAPRPPALRHPAHAQWDELQGQP